MSPSKEEVVVVVMPVVDVERTEPLVSPVHVGRHRWWYVVALLLFMAAAVTFAVFNQPEVTTNHTDTAATLPRPEWWQVLLGVVVGLILAVFIVMYMLHHVNFDLVTPT